MNYYNEWDKKTAAWLRELIKEGHLPDGEVDERSITDIEPRDLDGFTQCHFFAGIGGWPLALRMAGLPDDWPCWTGSCPCQPFSSAGAGKGVDDERHLWPAFRWLIAQCRPARVFGEQVASADGRTWLAGVLLDLEAMGYAGTGADLCAASVGAPHIRQRLFWMADAQLQRSNQRYKQPYSEGTTDRGVGSSSARGLEYPDSARPQQGRSAAETAGYRGSTQSAGGFGGLGNASVQRPPEQWRGWDKSAGQPEDRIPGYWDDFDTLHFRDGKTRRIEPGTSPLAHGLSARVVRLRGYGNAIVPQVAAEFITATMEALTHAD